MFVRSFRTSETRDRVRRLLGDELGACREADLRERLSELESPAAETSGTVRQDSTLLGTLGDETRLGLVRYLDGTDRAGAILSVLAETRPVERAREGQA